MTTAPTRPRSDAWIAALIALGAFDLVFLAIGLKGPSTCALSIVDCDAGIAQTVAILAGVVVVLVIAGLVTVRTAKARRRTFLTLLVVLLSTILLLAVATDWLAFGILGDFP